jgi:membrane-associated phospholipid phosphatase
MPATRVDASLLHEVQEGYGGAWGEFLTWSNALGSRPMKYPVAGLFAASLLVKDRRFQDAAFTSLEALVFAGALTITLKALFGRYRPEAGGTPRKFDPFSGNTSFPSGHTTAAFAIVTPWVLYYPDAPLYALFALSTGTAVARIARDKHWPSDVLAGAAVGYFTARWLTHHHQARPSPRMASFVPFIGRDGLGMQFTVHIP